MARKTGVSSKLDTDGHHLWLAGATDRQIAARLGCVPSLVCMWRGKLGLEANAPTGTADWMACRESLQEGRSLTIQLYDDGLDSLAASKQLGITAHAYRSRLRRLGLSVKRRKQ